MLRWEEYVDLETLKIQVMQEVNCALKFRREATTSADCHD
jgi:hypothetical protein